MRTPRAVLGACAVLLGGLVLVVGARLVHVHQQYWEWGLQPSATPPKIVVDGRDYRRSTSVAAPAAGEVLLSRTGDRGEVYGPATGTRVPTVVDIRTPRGTTAYVLMGGP